MSTTPTSHDEREAVEMLLPWYAVGTLDDGERQRVEAYLRDHPEMNDQLRLIAEEADAAIAVNEALGAPSPGAIDRLMERVRQDGPAPADARRSGLLQAIMEWFAGLTPGVAAFGAAAAIVVICVQAIALSLVLSGDPDRFRTATGGEVQEATGTVALVSFAPGTTVEQVTALLAGEGATIVGGPKPGGIYRVRLSDAVLPDAERDAALDRLRDNPLVQFAAPAG